MSVTIKQVAKAAKVSETTVSLAFQPGSRISDATRAKVLKTAQELNYVPNASARNLRHGRPRLLGALVNDLTNPFYSAMVRAMEVTAERQDYQVIVMESQWQGEREVFCLNRMVEARVRGVVLCQCEQTDEGRELLDRFGVAYVAVDTFPLNYKGPYVANDLAGAGRLAGDHLADAQCRTPVMVIPQHGRRRFSSFVRMQQGFAQALKRRDIPFDGSHLFGADLTITDGQRAFPEILERFPKVDGVLCGNDLCALGVMEAVDKAGLKVGRDVAVMGIDNLPVSELSRISLTTIEEPYQDIASEATRALMESIEANRPLTVRRMLPSRLIVRRSTQRN